mgnify:CR=1 FL=1
MSKSAQTNLNIVHFDNWVMTMKKNFLLLTLLLLPFFVGTEAAWANATMRVSANQIGQTYAVEVGQNKSLIVDLPV